MERREEDVRMWKGERRRKRRGLEAAHWQITDTKFTIHYMHPIHCTWFFPSLRLNSRLRYLVLYRGVMS